MADNLLKEVDEALRAERAAALWQKHRTTIVTFIAAIILGTAANSLWQHHRETKGGELLEALHANAELLSKGKAEEAAAGFKTIADGASGEVKDLALVWQSRAHVAAKQPKEAIAALEAAVADGHSLWADIACLRLAGLDAKAAAPCLAANASSPLAATRAEWTAANLWGEGKNAEAMAALEAHIANPDTSPDTRMRLKQWLASMKASQPPAPKN
jgi:hypothetical protein